MSLGITIACSVASRNDSRMHKIVFISYVIDNGRVGCIKADGPDVSDLASYTAASPVQPSTSTKQT